MGTKVCKFGGTSLADGKQLRKVQAIVQNDGDRRYVVPSAPGKRGPDDRKITDLLYLCHDHAKQNIPFDQVFNLVADRYRQILVELDMWFDIAPHLEKIKDEIADGASRDYAASRGEYLCGLILAELLGYTFIDAADVIRFDTRGQFDTTATGQALGPTLLKTEPVVIPGFYGGLPDGSVKTFPRGGSDITGAVIARAIGADVYENWTDVNGLLMADPCVVDNPKTIETITYRELRELAYMGATVLHDEAVFPVRDTGIPVNIRNTNQPNHPGTMIISSRTKPITHGGTITGIAGRKDFTVIAVEKALMNKELGFGRRLLNVLEVHGVSFEHMPSGIDTMSVVVADAQLKGKLDTILEDIRHECHPDVLEANPHMAVIATVGRGMAHIPGMAAKLFTALADAGVNIRMIDQGSSEINIIVGVETADFEAAVRAIYRAFVE